MRGEQMAVEGEETPRGTGDTRRPRGLTSAERETGGTPRGEGGEQAKSEVDSRPDACAARSRGGRRGWPSCRERKGGRGAENI